MTPQMDLFDVFSSCSSKADSTVALLSDLFEKPKLNLEVVNTNTKIEDFGEKIGGAKKDLWANRAMTVEDLDSMTEREAFKFVTKDLIWAKPDYEKLVENGMDPVAAYLLKKIRDSLPAKVTPTKNEAKNKELREKYITFLTELKELVENMDIKELSQFKSLSRKAIEKYYNFEHRYWNDEGRNHPAITNKFLKAVQIDQWDINKAKREVEKTGFPVKQEQWKKDIGIKELEGGFAIVRYLSKYRNRHEVLEEVFSSKEEAEKYLEKELKEELKSTGRRNSNNPIRPQLKHVQRIGETVRSGDVTGEDILQTFNFRGGEFGNWTNQADRQAYLNHGYEALSDLSKALQIEPSKLSMGGELAIAFGARGRGNALAHYEPSSKVINLTKLKGAGSLAHEMGHALDDYLGQLAEIKDSSDPFLSSSRYRTSKLEPAIQQAWINLMDAINSSDMSQEDMIKGLEKDLKRYQNNIAVKIEGILKALEKETGYSSRPRRAATPEEMSRAEVLVRTIEEVNKPEYAFTELCELYKSIKKIMVAKELRDDLPSYFNWRRITKENIEKAKAGDFTKRQTSNYVKAAKEIDKGRSKPYWSTSVELFARAFESFVYDELNSKGYRSDYLVYGVINSSYAESDKPYPEGKERENINNAFREFFKVVKVQDLL